MNTEYMGMDPRVMIYGYRSVQFFKHLQQYL